MNKSVSKQNESSENATQDINFSHSNTSGSRWSYISKPHSTPHHIDKVYGNIDKNPSSSKKEFDNNEVPSKANSELKTQLQQSRSALSVMKS